MWQLFILVKVVIREDRYAVLWLQHVGVARVINQNAVLKAPIDVAEILSEVASLQGAMLTIKSMRKVPFLRVKVVEYHICVGSAASSEDYDLCEGGQFTNEIEAMGPDSHSSLH